MNPLRNEAVVLWAYHGVGFARGLRLARFGEVAGTVDGLGEFGREGGSGGVSKHLLPGRRSSKNAPGQTRGVMLDPENASIARDLVTRSIGRARVLHAPLARCVLGKMTEALTVSASSWTCFGVLTKWLEVWKTGS